MSKKQNENPSIEQTKVTVEVHEQTNAKFRPDKSSC